MTRVPIRARIAIAFAAAIAALLVAVGLFVYLRLEAELDESIDQGLRSRAGELAAIVRTSGSALGGAGGGLIESDESFAQVVGRSGEVLDSTPQLASGPVVEGAELEAAAATPTFLVRDQVAGVEGPARLLAVPVRGPDGPAVAIVGSSLDDRDEALTSLAQLFLIGGPAALLVAVLAGYALAGVALRPVEAMRARAAAISASEPGERLPLPPAEDELRRLGVTLNAMLARLESALERERRFVDDASHELRTPLTLQKTELELALRHAAGEEDLREAIGSAIAEVDRLIELAENLLVVARFDQGGLELERESIACSELLTAVADRFRLRASGADRALTVEDGSDVVLGDRLRLEQALTNLVDNALRHGRGEVRLSARPAAEAVELHATDRGPGFPAGFAGRAFERFSRADESRSRGGSGLGLAIVDTIARAHGGTAGVANLPDGGADAWIAVPGADR